MPNYYQWQLIQAHHEEDIVLRHGYFRSKDDTTAKAKAIKDSESTRDVTKLRKKHGYGPTEWTFISETERHITIEKPVTETTYLKLIREK